MRWFFTDPHPLANALALLGEEIVSSEEAHTARYLSGAVTPTSYPLSALALGARAEVVVLVNPIRLFTVGDAHYEYGFGRGYAKALRNHRVWLAMVAEDNPVTFQKFRVKAYRSCTCNDQDAALHVVPDSASGDFVRGSRRTVVWNPGDGAEKVLEAAREIEQKKVYRGRVDGHRWG